MISNKQKCIKITKKNEVIKTDTIPYLHSIFVCVVHVKRGGGDPGLYVAKQVYSACGWWAAIAKAARPLQVTIFYTRRLEVGSTYCVCPLRGVS